VKHSFILKAMVLLAIPFTILADTKNPLSLISYVGIDAQIRHMDFEKNFGGNILQHRYPQANIFAGVKFNDYFGIEGGYTFSKKQHSTRLHQPTDLVFGEVLPAINPSLISQVNQSRASSKISGWNANLMGYLPIFCKEDNTQLIGSIGFASLKSRVHQLRITRNVFPEPFAPLSNTFTDTTYLKKHKAVLRLGAGMQHMVCDNVGLRFLAAWENTSKLKAYGQNPARVSVAISKPQNSFHYGLGAFGTF
jgi:hypothetical protein